MSLPQDHDRRHGPGPPQRRSKEGRDRFRHHVQPGGGHPDTTTATMEERTDGRKAPVNITQLERFLAMAEELHFPRTAQALGIPLASLYTSIEKLEDEIGQPLFTRGNGTQLTPAGQLLLAEAPQLRATLPPAVPKPVVPAGGKAKASKGKGRTPVVKGQPKPYKKRQGR